MPFCERCDRSFGSWSAYNQHQASSPMHNVCHLCDLDFPSFRGLKEHWVQSDDHSYCQYCDEHFNYEEDLQDHYDESHYYCRSCNKFFKNDVGLREHYRQSPFHHYCNTIFSSASNLKSHMNSSVHRPKDVKCPFRCGMAFVSRSALVLHLENGNCTSGISRAQINNIVRQYDTNGIITDPSRMITGGAASDDVEYIATRLSWNGSHYECYLCHRGFRNLPGLNQHLRSPIHKEKIYICRGPSCGIRFNALSGLVQHIESEKCGISKFKTVQNAMDSLLGQMGRLTM